MIFPKPIYVILNLRNGNFQKSNVNSTPPPLKWISSSKSALDKMQKTIPKKTFMTLTITLNLMRQTKGILEATQNLDNIVIIKLNYLNLQNSQPLPFSPPTVHLISLRKHSKLGILHYTHYSTQAFKLYKNSNPSVWNVRNHTQRLKIILIIYPTPSLINQDHCHLTLKRSL